MNILIINHYAGSPSLGMEFRPYYLAREWKRAGHEVMIVGGSFSHLRRQQPTSGKNGQPETIDGIRYLWLKTNQYQGNGLRRVLSMLVFVWHLFRVSGKLKNSFKPDLVIASSTYPLDNFPAAWLARISNAVYCYEVHDLWPLSPMELGGYSRWNPYIMVLQYAENYAYKNADLVVSMLPNTLDHMIEHGLSREKFVYVPNGIPVNDWSEEQDLPDGHRALLTSLQAEQRTIIGYVGGHSISNALDTLIDAAGRAQKSLPHVAFVLVGDGIEKARLVRKAADLKNVYFLASVPKDAVPRLLSYMDILYLGWHKSPLYRFGISPNKLLDYMMAAKPVIHSVTAANDMVSDAQCGISVPAERAELVVSAIESLHNKTREERERIGRRGREWVIANNDYKVLAQTFLEAATKFQRP